MSMSARSPAFNRPSDATEDSDMDWGIKTGLAQSAP
jgi:hypothetical protein